MIAAEPQLIAASASNRLAITWRKRFCLLIGYNNQKGYIMLKYIIVTHIVGAAFLAGSVSGCATDQDELDQQTDPASAESTADLGSGSPPVTSAGCGAVLDPSTPGGEAHWTITCGPNFAIIDGWVRDNRADNMCAWVKAFNDTTGEQMLPHAKACPKGTTTHFNWTTYGTNAIRAYLYIQ